MQEKEFQIMLSVIGWVLGFVGTLIAIIGGFVGYIFTRHREDNDCEHSEIKDIILSVKSEIKDDIIRIHERIDSHLEAENE